MVNRPSDLDHNVGSFCNFAGESVYISAGRFWVSGMRCDELEGYLGTRAGPDGNQCAPASLDGIGLVALLATTFEGDEETGHPDDDGDVPTHFDPLPLHPVNHAKHHGSDSHNSAK